MIMFIMRNNYVLSNTCSYTLVCPPVRGDNPRALVCPPVRGDNPRALVCPPVRGDNPRALARGLSPRTGGQTVV